MQESVLISATASIARIYLVQSTIEDGDKDLKEKVIYVTHADYVTHGNAKRSSTKRNCLLWKHMRENANANADVETQTNASTHVGHAEFYVPDQSFLLISVDIKGRYAVVPGFPWKFVADVCLTETSQRQELHRMSCWRKGFMNFLRVIFHATFELVELINSSHSAYLNDDCAFISEWMCKGGGIARVTTEKSEDNIG
ncbi:hypothetical protein EDD18DRAFT_1338571 [Armillaria luteobubalina]|uniref:Uncharacterized protein n=1 Tax=Armillaria luteobubalina TaxID=153913 RepID=A0AA39P2C9_9AGAR|nr:hypothetical protein EDD18DRAFT_1338571 [Armillaria luteobubalina]